MFELSSIPDRRAVWIAQSDLFLDTDVRLSFPYIARVAAASPYSLSELEAICRDEVAPIVESNLLEVAGEWAMFPEDWLIDSIVARLQTNPNVPYNMDTGTLKQWHSIAHLVAIVRALPEDQRHPRIQLWTSMIPLFLNRNPVPPADWTRADEAVFRHEMAPAYMPSVEIYRKHNPVIYPTAAEIEVAWLAWQS